jgi:methionine-rich copper-binding protein CopC
VSPTRKPAFAAGLLLTLSCLVVLAPPGAVPAAAHAIVLESSPAADAVLSRPPERVVLRFNSKIEKNLTRVTITGSDRVPRPVTLDESEGSADPSPDRFVGRLDPLAPGRYVIRYKVLSADGHITEGAIRFTVGASP